MDASQTKGGMQFGYALPGTAVGSNDEYFGLLVSMETMCYSYLLTISRSDRSRVVTKDGPESVMVAKWPMPSCSWPG